MIFLSASHLFLLLFFFLFNAPATTEIYTLSLHDALPIWSATLVSSSLRQAGRRHGLWRTNRLKRHISQTRSEEHTSELQSRFDLVCRLLLEKKNRITEPQEPAADLLKYWRFRSVSQHVPT